MFSAYSFDRLSFLSFNTFFFLSRFRDLEITEIPSNAGIPVFNMDDSHDTIRMHDEVISDDEEASHAFAKMLESSEKGMGPHEEVIEIINLGTEELKREVKMVDNPEREALIALFK